MIVFIDNYDSFTYNLVQAMLAEGAEITVYRNDEISVDDVAALKPAGLVISPGPCTPLDAGISVPLIQAMSGKVPLLGVCLGHQSIAQAFGATVSNASRIMHGKTSEVTYDEGPMYIGLDNPFTAGRYHSLSIVEETLPPELIVDARSDDGEIMGIHHSSHPTWGVQFHPESVLTPSGNQLLANFLKQTS
jgi:anthranilate synthase component 2